ncbi:TlpA family protein disulfide reductase [Natronospirillum operosum]|uniref:TlpA family protein disulfide reductase n=1 Tax=Natronospirillum operosum TaxID=2759953 RepID=A0A4Z0WCB1_9GAMM|nr:TlpA disulfide reductase family protein [Natronospirillum operosum]TGG93553.1 TlpA family protein disulfide reductase [Natronospirillum operosum]
MPESVTLGPLFIPMDRLLFVLAMMTVLLLSFVLERRYRLLGAPGLWLVLLSGFGAGRVVHVIEHWSVYSRNPMDSLYLWQGGFHWPVGVLVALGVALLWSRRRRQPLALHMAPVLAGTLVWVGGSLFLDTQQARSVPLPELRVSDMASEPVLLTDLRGQPTVINLWASWCPPCRREMPTFERAQDNWPDIHFVYINQGEDAATARQYLEEHERRLETVLIDGPSLLSRHFEAHGLPTTLFFDASGQMTAIHPGEISAVQLEGYLGGL